MKILYIQYGAFGTFNHVYQYSLVDKNLTIISRAENKITENENENNQEIKANSKIDFALKIQKILKNISNYDKNIVIYYVGCFLLNILCRKKKFILDIRTFSINRNKIKRIILNNIINIEALFFEKILILSEGMQKQLWKVNRKKSNIVPLGAEEPKFYDKKLKSIKKEKIFIYVGTFNDRKIEDLIIAFDKFCEFGLDYKLQIIGRGNTEEIERVVNTIKKCKNLSSIEYLGEVRFPDLARYLSKASIGLSYIPINEKYENQPPTKTYEYLFSGCFVIASGTIENKKIINDNNGIIIENNKNSLMNAMIKSCEFDITKLKLSENIAEFSWTKIYYKLTLV